MEPLFRSSVLMIIAHWDDEVLSAGGTLVKYGKDFTIISATYRPMHEEYRTIFNNICREISAKAFTLSVCHRVRSSNITKDTPKTELNSILINKKLTELFGNYNVKFNTVITHNPNKADPNHHVQHIQLANSITNLFKDKDIYYFVGWPGGRKEDIEEIKKYNNSNSTHVIELNKEQLKKKKDFIRRYKPDYLWLRPEGEVINKEWYERKA